MTRGTREAKSGRRTRVILGLGLLLALPAVCAAAESPCDPHLLRPETDAQGYKLRGDRCEGLFVSEKAGSRLRVVSFTQSFESFDVQTTKSLEIRWPPANGGPMHLRANSLREGFYYRMDAVRPAGETVYRWPTDMLAVLGVTRKDLGLLGWTIQGDRDVYLPLRVGDVGAAPGKYQLVIVPGVQLTRVFVTVRSVGADPEQRRSLDLGENAYFPEVPVVISFDLPATAPPGVYAIEVGATLDQGGTATLALSFSHPGP